MSIESQKLLVVGFAHLVLGIILGMGIWANFGPRKETVVYPDKRYEIVMKCQELVAMTQNANFIYKYCIQDLENALKPKGNAQAL